VVNTALLVAEADWLSSQRLALLGPDLEHRNLRIDLMDCISNQHTTLVLLSDHWCAPLSCSLNDSLSPDIGRTPDSSVFKDVCLSLEEITF
jgi:hypothetical protein